MKKILFIALVCLFTITTFAQTKYNVYKKQLINQKGKIVSSEATTGVVVIDLWGNFKVKSKELGLNISVKMYEDVEMWGEKFSIGRDSKYQSNTYAAYNFKNKKKRWFAYLSPGSRYWVRYYIELIQFLGKPGASLNLLFQLKKQK